MKKALSFLISLPLVAQATLPARAQVAAPEAAKNIQPQAASVQPSHAPVTAPLRGEDVLAMLGAGLSAEMIVARIQTSACDFDTSPAALQKLKAAGAPDAVVVAMVTAPKKTAAAREASGGAVERVKVPAGIVVEVEAAYTVSSQDVRAGDALSFRVVNPVKVSGVTVVAEGATATGRVVKASRGGHFGRAGRLAWEMREVTAADGTRLPLQAGGRVVGDSKGAKVATQTVLVGVLLGPFAPLSLLHGFKRGENAYLPAGKRFEVYVSGETFVTPPPAR